MDVVRLRICTWKSIIDFGMYAGMSVHQIFSLKHTNYLRWLYYNCSSISYTEEILMAIHIISDNIDHRIEKPGTNPELHLEMNEYFFKAMIKEKGSVVWVLNTLKLNSRRKVRSGNYRQFKEQSKSKLQSKNQGH